MDSIHETESAHEMVSIAGGGAFLHALSSSTRALHLVDRDPEIFSFMTFLRELVEHAPTREDFFECLTGWQVDLSEERSGITFRRPLHQKVRQTLRSVLSQQSWDLYERTFAQLVIDPATKSGLIGDARILFQGIDLTPMHFCWHAGEYAWQSEERYEMLRSILRSVPVTYYPIEMSSFLSSFAPKSPRFIVLASNAESHLFTPGDEIFLGASVIPCESWRYVSWARDFGSRSIPVGISTIEQTQTLERWRGAAFIPSPQSPYSLLFQEPVYNKEVLIIDSRDEPIDEEVVTRLSPSYRQVYWLSSKPCEAFPLASRSYDVHALTGGSSGYLFSLRGIRRGDNAVFG